MSADGPPAETPLRRGLLVALRLLVAGVFITASVDKIIHPDRFADIVWDYQILPAVLGNPFSVCLPWVELALGVCLVVGIWVPSAALVACALTATFMAAIAMNLARGNAHLNCGCFTTSESGKSGAWGLLWRDGLLLAATVWLFLTAYGREA